jgi:hypothetical protein
MASLAVQLPLTKDSTDGFKMIKDFNQAKFKNVVANKSWRTSDGAIVWSWDANVPI